MEKVHIRNIFRVFVPLDINLGSGTAQTKQEPFGLEYVQHDLLLNLNVRFLCTDAYGNIKREPPASLTWAKRTPMILQQKTRTDPANGLYLRLKVNQGVMDFRKTKDRSFQIVVEIVENGSVMKTGTSTIWELFPKKRQFNAIEEGEEEALVPIFWVGEDGFLNDNQQHNKSPDSISVQSVQDSSLEENPVQIQYLNQREPNPFQLASISTDDYERPNVNENYMVLYNGNAEVVGNFRALNFYKASDINIKEDIRLLKQDRDCRATMLQINGVEYKFKSGISHATNKRFIGYIAQQVESVVPEAVQLIDGILHVDYESLIPYLSESMKQNYNDVKSVTTEVFQMKHVLDTLYERFAASEKKQQKSEQKQTKSSLRRWKVIGWTAGALAFSALLSVIIMWMFWPPSISLLKPPTTMPLDPPFIGNLTPLSNGSDLERLFLEEVFRAILAEDDERLQKSNLDQPHCTWKGVMCDPFTGKVSVISLSGVGRESTVPDTKPFIPTVIGNFTDLQTLILTSNNLGSTIPESIANLHQLQYLSLGYNHLVGTVPDLRSLQKLNVLHLSNNLLSGTLDNIMAAPALNKFNAESNQFKTELPEKISPSLTEISLSSCQLHGTIPVSWTSNTRTMIDLSQNNLNGSVPCFGPNVYILSLARNNLDGEFCGSKLSNVRHIYVAENRLTGTFDLPNVDLANSKITLSIDSNLFTLFAPSAMNVTFADPNSLICSAYKNPWRCPLPTWAAKSCGVFSCIGEQ